MASYHIQEKSILLVSKFADSLIIFRGNIYFDYQAKSGMEMVSFKLIYSENC